jgi:hypothetical protein
MVARNTLLVILLMLTFAVPLFAAETLVKPEITTPIEICPSCKEVRVLLVPDSKLKINLNDGPEVESAYFNGSIPRDAGKFTAKWIGEKFPREIRVVLDTEETKQAGMYDLYLNLQPVSEPGEGRLKIQLMRPAASLEAIPKLIIDRKFKFSWSSDYPDLRVTETSKKSKITISGIRPVSNSVIDAKTIGGTLGFPQKHVEIEPGDQVKLDYKLDGSFELGTATGTMKIDAPQLASPISFDFEVRSRVHWMWIGITIIVALFLSWGVKVVLQHKIEIVQARVDAQKLIEMIALEEKRHKEPNFAAAYSKEKSDLTEAIKGKDPNAINKAKSYLDDKWRKELEKLDKQHQDEKIALDKLSDITINHWLVPPQVVKAIDGARTAQARVMQLLECDDLTKASNERQMILSTLGDNIRTAAIDWQTLELEIVKAIQKEPPGIPAAISAELAKTTTDLLASLHKVDASTKLDTTEQILQTLNDLKFERNLVYQFVDWLSAVIQGVCDSAALKIPDPPPAEWNTEAFALAPAAVNKFTSFLKKELVDNPDAQKVPAQINEVHKAWTHALQGQFKTLNGQVDMHLNARDYVQATMAAVEEMGKSKGFSYFTTQHPSYELIVPEFHRYMVGTLSQPTYALRTWYNVVTAPAPAMPTSVTLGKELMWDKGLQSAIIGLLLIVAGYGLQLNTFVGTFTDFSTLFFWAFALDLTVDQVKTLTKKTWP